MCKQLSTNNNQIKFICVLNKTFRWLSCKENVVGKSFLRFSGAALCVDGSQIWAKEK